MHRLEDPTALSFLKRLLVETGVGCEAVMLHLLEHACDECVKMLMLHPFNFKEDALDVLPDDEESNRAKERLRRINESLFAPGGEGFAAASSSFDDAKRQRV